MTRNISAPSLSTTTKHVLSWADFTEEIYKDAGIAAKVERVTTEEYEQMAGRAVAKRPSNSRLEKSKLVENGFRLLPDWKDAVSRYLAVLNHEEVELKS